MAIGCRNQKCIFLCSLFSIFCSSSLFCYGANNITRGQQIRDGEFLVSEDEKFAFGFFSPGDSRYRYVGIWYNRISMETVVWVANREHPISDRGGILTIGRDGNLVVLDGNGNSVWSTNVSVESKSSTVILMDTGDLVLLGSNTVHDSNEALWQSFNHPTDTFLPDMKVYMHVESGQTRVFNSWKRDDDPSPGDFSMGIDSRGSPQVVIWKGVNRHWRSGHWNGLVFTGVPSMRVLYLYGFRLFNEGDGRIYFTYSSSNNSDLIRFRVTWEGTEKQVLWKDNIQGWNVIQMHPVNDCETYNLCGPFGKCNIDMESPICSCMQGFIPKYIVEWNNGKYSGGCIRRAQSQCEEGGEEDGFLKIEGVKLPDFMDLGGCENMKECEAKCLKNCSCNAFAFVSGINCMMWSGDLVDVQQFNEGGNTLYLRLAKSELGGLNRVTRLIIIAITVVGTFFASVSLGLLWRYRAKLKAIFDSLRNNSKTPKIGTSGSGGFSTDFSGSNDLTVEGQQGAGVELVLFNFNDIAAATNNFDVKNKLGQGGFGSVYKGKLQEGQEIAVKRLSAKSGQGLQEFKNEIILIAKLQHINLVRLLGCCIQGEEKILLYEYMPNKSLDSFIFDPAKQADLDWTLRFKIIEGIARGLLYLHRDSRLRIIHRDLKASNILLDGEMSPKISDFGMARIFGVNQNEANTNRVVGTYGYMAPEYAMEGLFSVKSDVYSFGVLLLEIVSGRRNTSFRSAAYSNIIGYAWDLWAGDKAMDLVDRSVVDSYSRDEVLRCINVGLLCVQDLAVHRPTMSSVLRMLETETATVPMPKQPTLTSMRGSVDMDFGKGCYEIGSSNNVTVTMIVGR